MSSENDHQSLVSRNFNIEVEKCILCGDKSSGGSDRYYFPLRSDRRSMKAVFYEVFHHLLISHKDIPQVYRLCRHGPFCLRCMKKLNDVWTMQKTIAKTQILMVNTAESIGKRIAATPLFAFDKALKRSKKDRDLWTHLRNPVIQNFAKDLLPMPRVVLSDIIEEGKNKRRRSISGNDGNKGGGGGGGSPKIPRTSTSNGIETHKTNDANETQCSSIVPYDSDKGNGTDVHMSEGRPSTAVSTHSAEVGIDNNTNTNDGNQKSQDSKKSTGTKVNAIQSQSPSELTVTDTPQSVTSTSTSVSTTTTCNNEVVTSPNGTQNTFLAPVSHPGMQGPFVQQFAPSGHAVFVSYVPIEALNDRTTNFDRVGLSYGRTPTPSHSSHSPCDRSVSDASEFATSIKRRDSNHGRFENVELPTSSPSAIAIQSEISGEMSKEKSPSSFSETLTGINIPSKITESNSSDVRLETQEDNNFEDIVDNADITMNELDPGPSSLTSNLVFDSAVCNSSISTQDSSSRELENENNNTYQSLLTVSCPKCDFRVEDTSKEKILQRIYIHYGREHLNVDKDDPSFSEEGLEFYKCQLCPFRSFINAYNLNTRRSKNIDRKQDAIMSLAQHCIGVHEPMIEPTLAKPSPVCPEPEREQPERSIRCAIKGCRFEVTQQSKAGRNGMYSKMGYHYLKSHIYPEFLLLDSNHPCFHNSPEGIYFKCPSCSATFAAATQDSQSRKSASRQFVIHLAKSHGISRASFSVPSAPLKNSSKPKSLDMSRSPPTSVQIPKRFLVPGMAGVKCTECDSVIRTTNRWKFRCAADVKRFLKNDFKRHYLEVHKRRTVPRVELDILDTNGKPYENLKINLSPEDTLKSVSNHKLEQSQDQSYLNRTKCPLCAFTTKEQHDKNGRFHALTLHFMSHIPVKSPDSESLSLDKEQNDDGMICLPNVYVCKQCPFMSVAKPEGSSMTDLHEYLAEHYLRAHYPEDNLDNYDPSMSPSANCSATNEMVSQENTPNDTSTLNKCSSEEVTDETLDFEFDEVREDHQEEITIINSIKIEDSQDRTLMDWEIDDFEEMEISNVREVTNAEKDNPNDFSSITAQKSAVETSQTTTETESVKSQTLDVDAETQDRAKCTNESSETIRADTDDTSQAPQNIIIITNPEPEDLNEEIEIEQEIIPPVSISAPSLSPAPIIIPAKTSSRENYGWDIADSTSTEDESCS